MLWLWASIRPKPEELLPQRVLVLLLGSPHLVANFLFLKMCRFPFINRGYRMIDRGEGFLLPDCSYPFLDRGLVGALHFIEFRSVIHPTPPDVMWHANSARGSIGAMVIPLGT